MQRAKDFIESHPTLLAFVLYATVAMVYAVLTDGVLRDDAYIFFMYAKSLAATGMLSFNPGELSFGTTSIAWTGLLTGGALLGFNIVGVAKILGTLLGAAGTTLFVSWLCRKLDRPFSIGAVILAALLPNIGADRMVEGMETGLLCFAFGLCLFLLQDRHGIRPWLIGAAIGLLTLTRPEMALIGLILTIAILRMDGIQSAVKVAVGAVAVSVWWPLWLYQQIGTVVPPTRIGKLSVFLPENVGLTYEQYSHTGFVERTIVGLNALMTFVRSGISESSLFLLLIAATLVVGLALVRSGFRRYWPLGIAPATAWLVIALYCTSFPLFQLRYFTWIVGPIAASFWVLVSDRAAIRIPRFALGAVLIACLCAQPFALMRRIDSTRVQQLRRSVAEVINRQTPPSARIALEPIGEIGFCADRYIVDMGGILDTRFQPLLANGYSAVDSVLTVLRAARADYLVTYDTDAFLGRLPSRYPDQFQLVTYIPDEPVRGVRYRLLKIVGLTPSPIP